MNDENEQNKSRPVYRMHRYGHKAWEIQEKRVSGEKSKNPGQVTWVSVAYPGSLLHAAKWLIDAAFDTDEAHEHLESLQAEFDAIQVKLMKFMMDNEDKEFEV